jgi:hypothetical protein
VYLRCRQLWEPELDLDAGLRRYCMAAFGAGAEPMVRFYRHWAALREHDLVAGGVTPNHAGAWPNRQWRDILLQFAEREDDDFEYSLRCIAEAAEGTRDPAAAQRLEMVRVFMRDSAGLFHMHQLIRKAIDPETTQGSSEFMSVALDLLADRRERLSAMREHPEWFTGTSAEVAEDLSPSWEKRASVKLDEEILNAIAACLIASPAGKIPAPLTATLPPALRPYCAPFEAEQVRLHTRETHPWYPESRNVRLTAPRRGHEIEFRSITDAARITDHPFLAGERKVHWLAGFAVNCPMDPSSLYRLRITAQAGAGRLRVRCSTGGGSAGQSNMHVLEDFPAQGDRVRRDVVLLPFALDPRSLEIRGNPAQAKARDKKGMVSIYMTWQPRADGASLQGTLTLDRLLF